MHFKHMESIKFAILVAGWRSIKHQFESNIFSSPELKVHLSFSDQDLPVVCRRRRCRKLFHTVIDLLQNHWTDFNF